MLVWGFAGIYCLLTYIFFREKTLNGHDPANYFLGIKYGFSLAAERPHAPGYPFFIFFGQIISSIFSIDPHAAILVLNKIYIFFGIGLCYQFVKKYWSSATSIITVLLVACNPVVLFYGSVGEIYIYDLFFSTAILYLMTACRPKLMPLAFFVLGVSMGFRLPSVILLAPVIVMALYFRSDIKEFFSVRRIALIMLSFVLGMCTWLIPFYISSGGIQIFQQALRDAAELDSTIYQNAAAYGSYLLWTVNIGFIVLFFHSGKNNSTSKQKKILLLVWFIIPTLFYIFEHYSRGHILLILPCIIIPIADHIGRIRSDWIKRSVLLFLLTINLSLFFFMPFMTPSAESNLPKAQRSSGERMQTAFLRSLSFFAPTYLHITIADEAITEANTMIGKNCLPGSVIIVDNSATLWAYPRSLQAANPSLYFIQGNSKDTNVVALFHESEIDRKYSIEKLLAGDTLYYLIDPRFVQTFGAPSDAKLLVSGSRTALYIVTGKEKDSFWKYFTKSK